MENATETIVPLGQLRPAESEKDKRLARYWLLLREAADAGGLAQTQADELAWIAGELEIAPTTFDEHKDAAGRVKPLRDRAARAETALAASTEAESALDHLNAEWQKVAADFAQRLDSARATLNRAIGRSGDNADAELRGLLLRFPGLNETPAPAPLPTFNDGRLESLRRAAETSLTGRVSFDSRPHAERMLEAMRFAIRAKYREALATDDAIHAALEAMTPKLLAIISRQIQAEPTAEYESFDFPK